MTPPPVLLLTTEGDRQLVSRCCRRATAVGVRPGMTLAHARAMLPEAAEHTSHQPHGAALGDLGAGPQIDPISGALLAFDDPDRDQRKLHQLAAWANRFSPIVAPDSPDGLMLDIAGCQRIFKGENNLLRVLLQSIRQLGFEARAAIAPTFGCAWACARYALTDAASIIVNDDELEVAMSPLPVDALRIDQPTIDALAELSIHRVKQVIALPRASLPSRFGPLLLHRLDQALSRAGETIAPVVVEPPVHASRFFDGPCKQLDALCEASRLLIGDIAAQLQKQERGLGRMTLSIWRCNAPPLKLSVGLSHTTRCVKHLWSLLRPQLEKANMGFGVDGLTLTAGRCCAMAHDQAMHWPEADATHDQAAHDQALGQWLDAMQQRLGRESVARLQPAESHIPERAWHLRQIDSVDQITGRRRRRNPARTRSASDNASSRSRRKPRSAARTFGSSRQTKPAGITPAQRPTVLFDPPRPVDVIAITPDGPPSRIRHQSLMQNVRTSAGPERVTAEWWRNHAGSDGGGRDYYRIEDDQGCWLWVYRDHSTGRWFLHGQWA